MSGLIWLVSDDIRGPLGLARVSANGVTMLAGDGRVTKAFKNGAPDLAISKSWYFEVISHRACFPRIGELISALGPVTDAQSRLEMERLRSRRANEGRAKAKRAKSLTDSELREIDRQLLAGVKLKRIAEKFGLAISFLRRRKSENTPTDTNVPDSVFHALKPSQSGRSGRANNATRGDSL